jgi:hypothetical protein
MGLDSFESSWIGLEKGLLGLDRFEKSERGLIMTECASEARNLIMEYLRSPKS